MDQKRKLYQCFLWRSKPKPRGGYVWIIEKNSRKKNRKTLILLDFFAFLSPPKHRQVSPGSCRVPSSAGPAGPLLAVKVERTVRRKTPRKFWKFYLEIFLKWFKISLSYSSQLFQCLFPQKPRDLVLFFKKILHFCPNKSIAFHPWPTTQLPPAPSNAPPKRGVRVLWLWAPRPLEAVNDESKVVVVSYFV